VLIAATAASCGGGGGSGASAYCDAVTELGDDLSDLGDLDLSNPDEATDYAKGWADVVSKLSRDAPEELSDAFTELGDSFDALDKELRDGNLAEVIANGDGLDLIDDLDGRKVSSALTEIDDFTSENCDERIKAERNVGALVEAAPLLTADGPEPDDTAVNTIPPPPDTATPPPDTTTPPVSTTRPPLVLPTNPQGTTPPPPPPVTDAPTNDTIVREPTQEEAQLLSTAIKDTWPVLSAEQATCVGTEMLRLFVFDDIVTMLENGDTALDGALFLAAVICEVDTDIFFG
jgi:hypothetical protein